MTPHQNKVTPAGSTSTMDDTALWQMYASAMRYSPDHVTPEVEKQTLLQMLLSASGGREGAIQYLEYVKQTLHPDAVQIGFQCPKRDIQCKSVEFDNIKVFYHPTWPDHLPPVGDTWNFYIARPGASPSECIDWATEGIDIVAYGLDGRWGECRMLSVTPGTRVRISYTFRHQRRTREIVFPSSDPPVHTLHLEHM